MKDLDLIFEEWRNFKNSTNKEIISESVGKRFIDRLTGGANDFDLVVMRAPQNKILLLSIYQNLLEEFDYLKTSSSADTEEYHDKSDKILRRDMSDITPEERDEIILYLKEKIKLLTPDSNEE